MQAEPTIFSPTIYVLDKRIEVYSIAFQLFFNRIL